MSERFYLTASPAEIKRQFKLDKVPELVPRYNIAPTQPSPIVVAKEKSSSRHAGVWCRHGRVTSR